MVTYAGFKQEARCDYLHQQEELIIINPKIVDLERELSALNEEIAQFFFYYNINTFAKVHLPEIKKNIIIENGDLKLKLTF